MVAGRADAPIDRYVVLEYLAEGGMGAIYLGKKLGAGGFEKHVVLKQLLPEFTRQPEFIDLFLREARLSATLDHANIIHTIDLVTAGEEHFIVMEYLDGADLRTLLKRAKRRNRRVSAGAAIFIGREMLSALAYAHNKLGDDDKPLRLIHRDISPSNILISGTGEVKLTDFGIAKASTHNSVFYRVKGKVGYMSPEQARSETLDSRSDLYSLAVVLYEVITGERLFVNAGLTTSADEMYSQPVPMVSHKVPGLPAELDKIMLRALSVDPAHRYQSAGALQEALIRCAHRHGLMMSTSVLAEHLRETCGDPRSWRDEGERADSDSHGGGTEIYDDSDMTGSGELDLVQLGGHNELLDRARRKRDHVKTSLTHLTELKGIELTSMLHMASDDHAGADPLLDLDAESESLLSKSGLTGESPAITETTMPREPERDEHRYTPLGSASATLSPPLSFGGFGKQAPPGAAFSASGLPRGETLHGPDPGKHVDLGPVPELTKTRRSRVSWLLLVLFFLLGLGAAAAIGLTGPSINVDEAATLPRAKDDSAKASDKVGTSQAPPTPTKPR